MENDETIFLRDYKVVNIQNHWFVGIPTFLCDENKMNIIGEGKTKEEAISGAFKIIYEFCKEKHNQLLKIMLQIGGEDLFYEKIVIPNLNICPKTLRPMKDEDLEHNEINYRNLLCYNDKEKRWVFGIE